MDHDQIFTNSLRNEKNAEVFHKTQFVQYNVLLFEDYVLLITFGIRILF